MDFTRFELNLISISVLKLCLNRGSPRVLFSLADTLSGGSRLEAVGLKQI
jgi:hypothetical protein